MSMLSPEALVQAREFLLEGSAERIRLVHHLHEQGQKIAALEQEVQIQMTAREQAEQALADAQREIEALRAQLPTAATIAAYNELVECLTAPSEIDSKLRIAA